MVRSNQVSRGQKKLVWSAMALKQAMACPLQWAYAHGRRSGQSPDYTLGVYAYGIQIHRMIADFWNVKKERLKYSSPESAANTFGARWNRIVANGKSQGKRILWSSESQPWQLRERGKRAMSYLHGFYKDRPIPIATEVAFRFFANGHLFEGRIDEINKGPLIRDHKGRFERVPQDQAHTDPQFSLYAIGLLSVAYNDESFAERVGVPFGNHCDFRDYLVCNLEKVLIEIHNFEDDNESQRIVRTKRSVSAFDDLLVFVDNFLVMDALRTYHHNRLACASCFYRSHCWQNVEVRPIQLPLLSLKFKPPKTKQRLRRLKLEFTPTQ